MLDVGTILELHSPWASMVVLVWKKDGSLRFSIDLRKLNNQTINDTYSLPHIEETFSSLQGSEWFSLFDLKSWYWQVKMDEEHKPLTTFTVGLLGFYEYNRMPFRLTNAPATFQQLMETCLGDLDFNWCIIYLDYIVIFSKDLASHLERLEAMFQKLEWAGLKLKTSKCKLFCRQITNLGHIVSVQGIVTDKGKNDDLENGLPLPLSQRSRASWSLWGITAGSSPSLQKWPDLYTNWHPMKKQARRRQPSPGMTVASSHSMTWSGCALWHLFLPMLILGGLSSSIPTFAGMAWGQSSIRLPMMGPMLSKPMPVGVWQRLKPTTPPMNWSFHPKVGHGREIP